MKPKSVETLSPLVVVPDAVVIKTRSLCVDNLPPLWEENLEFKDGEAGIPQASGLLKTRSLFTGKLPLRSVLVGYIPVRLDMAAAPSDYMGTPPNLPERIAFELRDQEARYAHEGAAATLELQAEWEQLQVLCAEARLALFPHDADAEAASTAELRVPAREDMEQAREALGGSLATEAQDMSARKGKKAVKQKVTAVAKGGKEMAKAGVKAGLGHVRRSSGDPEEDLQRKKQEIMRKLSLNCCSGTPEEVEKRRRQMHRQLSVNPSGRDLLAAAAHK